MTDQKLIAGLEKTLEAVKEAMALRGDPVDLVPAPTCRLDLGTYRLLAQQASWGKYGEFLSKAVQQVGPLVDDEKIRMTSILVKAHREAGNTQVVRSRIASMELRWVEEVAARCGIRTRAVLESVLYLYTRASA